MYIYNHKLLFFSTALNDAGRKATPVLYMKNMISFYVILSYFPFAIELPHFILYVPK